MQKQIYELDNEQLDREIEEAKNDLDQEMKSGHNVICIGLAQRLEKLFFEKAGRCELAKINEQTGR